MASFEEIKQEILARLDIVDVVGPYVQLKRAGRDYKGLSPFTKEKTPSFVVHPDEQFFKCFSTGEGGNVFDFIMKVEGMDFMGAMRHLGKRAGLPIEDMLDRGKRTKGPGKERLYTLLGGLAKHYREILLHDPRAEKARAYVKHRNLDGDIGEEFLIGFAPKAWDLCRDWAKANGFGDRELELTGMLSHKERDDGSRSEGYDRFRDRLMFPIRNETARVIGFSGRVIDPKSSPAKYVNSPETSLFKKSKVLYGVDLARKPMVDKRTAMVCEGQIDVIRCHQHGFRNAVAAQGTALTADHAKVLKRSADEILLVMDSDSAGVKAALRSGEVFLENGLAVRVATLPEGDPDTILENQGPEAFQTILEAATSFFDFHCSVLLEQHDPKSEVGLERITSELLQSIVRLPSAVAREQALRNIAERLDIPPEALRSDLERRVAPKYAQEVARRQTRQEIRARESVPAPQFQMPGTHDPAEEALLRMLILHPELGEVAVRHLSPDCLNHPALQDVFLAFVAAPHQGRDSLIEHLEDHPACPDGLVPRLSAAQTTGATEIGTPEEALEDIMRRLHILRLKRLRDVLNHAYHQAGEITRQKIFTETAQLTRQIKEIEGQPWENASSLIRILLETPSDKSDVMT